MNPRLTFSAAAGFEAARHITDGRAGEHLKRMHGHSFRVEARAAIPEGWGGFQGAEAVALQQNLGKVVSLLDYRCLNDVMADPSDVSLAAFVREALSLPELERLNLWSGAEKGVTLDASGQVHAWRRYRFESAHRLPNVPAGHKCGRMHGHGFEVVLHAGPEDISALERAWASCHQILHLACLNEIPRLENPTSERLSVWIWNELRPWVRSLSCVTVFETASCGSVYNGALHHIWKDVSFDSATRLQHAPETDGHRQLHGHTYTLRLGLTALLDEVMGWTVDFGDVKILFEPVFQQLDHHPLHEKSSSGDLASLLRWIYDRASPLLPALDRMELFDTPGTGAVLTCSGAPTFVAC
jgi:6-pyruvoyltetrahydropterin/6-carboxytetrahydropterin synthase